MKKYNEDYSGFVNPPTSAYPYGSPKNATTDTAEDGTPVEEGWVSDAWGFFQSAVDEAGITPNGQAESVANPQILNAIKSITDDRALNTFSNPNHIPNHDFSQPGDTTQPPPSATPADYDPGYEIYQGWFAGASGAGQITYTNGMINETGSAGVKSGSMYTDIPKSGKLEFLTEFTSSIASDSLSPVQDTSKIDFTDEGDYWRVTIDLSTATDVFSSKFESGDKATRHVVKSLFDIYGDPALTGVINVKSFGAIGDGVTNDTPAFQKAVNKLKETGYPIYVPATKNFYLMGDSGGQVLAQDLSVDFVMFGDGQSSLIKVGGGTMVADFNQTFFISPSDGSFINVHIHDLFINPNATENPLPPGAGDFEWEHNHAFAIQCNGVRSIQSVYIHGLFATDPVADIVNIGGGASNSAGSVIISGMNVTNRNRVRSDITITADYDTVLISDGDVTSIEVETNSTGANSEGKLSISNATTNKLDILYKGFATEATISNVTVNGFANIDGYVCKFSNCNFTLNKTLRLVGSGSSVDVEHSFDHCSFTEGDSFSSSITPLRLMYTSTAATSPKSIKMKNCKFKPKTVDHVYVNENAMFSGSEVSFFDCEFGDGANDSDVLMRSGLFNFESCKFKRSTGTGVRSSTTNILPNECEYRFIDNFVENEGVYLFEPHIAGNKTDIYMKGNISASGLGNIINFTRYDKIAPPRGTGAELNFKTVDTGDSNGIPTSGKYVSGNRVWYESPALGSVGAACVSSGEPGTWVEF